MEICVRTDLFKKRFGFAKVAGCEQHFGLSHPDFRDQRIAGKASREAGKRGFRLRCLFECFLSNTQRVERVGSECVLRKLLNQFGIRCRGTVKQFLLVETFASIVQRASNQWALRKLPLEDLQRSLGLRIISWFFGSLSLSVLRDSQIDHRLIELFELRILCYHGAERFDCQVVLLLLEQARAEVMLSFILPRIVGVLSQESLPLVACKVVELLILNPDGGCKLSCCGFGFLSCRCVDINHRQRQPE